MYRFNVNARNTQIVWGNGVEYFAHVCTMRVQLYTRVNYFCLTTCLTQVSESNGRTAERPYDLHSVDCGVSLYSRLVQ
jgi:hypothetical protein